MSNSNNLNIKKHKNKYFERNIPSQDGVGIEECFFLLNPFESLGYQDLTVLF